MDDNKIKQLLREELVKSDLEREFKKFINSSELKNKINEIVLQMVKNNKSVEDKVIDISSNVLIQLYKSLWNKRSFWVSQLKNKGA